MKRLLQNLKLTGLLLFAGTSFAIAQNNTNTTCAEALPVCPDNNFGRNIVSEVGDNQQGEEGPDYGCNATQPNPLWYYFRVSQSGTAIFDLEQYTGIDQTGELIDVDFTLWGPFESENVCDQLTTEMLVDSSYDPTGDETIDFYNGDGCGAEPTENAQMVNAGEVYILVVTNYSRRAGYINLIPRDEMTATFDCSILGPSYEFCDIGGDGVESVNLDDYIDEINGGDPNIGVTFHTTSQDAYNYINPLPSSQTLTDVPLTVYARKENYITTAVEVVVLSFTLIPEPELQEATLTACDNNQDGVELFDLTQANVQVNAEDEMTLTYYLTQEDADNEQNPIADPTYFSSGPADIIVRADVGDCYATTIIHLELIDTIVLTPLTVEVCDDDSDGLYTFDLNEYSDEILNNNTGTIQFYENEADAIAGNENYIQDTAAYQTGSTVLYAYVSGAGGCNATTELTLTVNPSPFMTEGLVYEFCDNEADNTETIDINAAQADLVDDATGITFYYFTSEADAQNAVLENAITDPAAYVLTADTVLYVLAMHENGCSALQSVSFNLLEGVTVQDAELLVCGDGTGQATFDLTDAAIAENFDNITYYLTEEDAQNGTNPISDPSAFETATPATVYAVVSIGECSSTAVISLDLFEDLQANPYEYSVCDEDGNGTETFNLNDFSDEIAGSASTDIFFYMNEADAEAGNENYIQGADSFETGTVTLYVLARSGECSAVTTLTLNVLDAPQANDVVEPYTYCDNFTDGTETVDLTVAFADVVSSTTGLTAEYYLSEADAQSGDSALAIADPASYAITGNTTVYIRVFTGDCFDVAMVTFTLSEGIAVTDDTLYACFAENGQGTFDLTTAEINPTASVTYHTNESDAVTGNAPIGNPAAYTTSVPGTVYVHVFDGECVNTAEITLEFFAQPEIPLDDQYSLCSGQTETVDVGSGFSAVTWSTGETTQSITLSELGDYWVDVTDANGCTFRHEFTVISGIAPMISNVDEGPDSFTVTAEGGVPPYQYSVGGFVWQDINTFANLVPGTYNLYVRGSDGCISAVEVASVFQWPTLFTPNGDGVNDTFRVPGLEVYPGSHIRIFDRYGALIHESAVSSNVLWDGTDMSGNKVSTQDYWYILDVGDGRKFTGHVTVKNRTEKGR